MSQEKSVVNRLNKNETLKSQGFSFTKEFEIGTRALNIKHKNGKKVMIDLDKDGAIEKINEFIKNQLSTINNEFAT